MQNAKRSRYVFFDIIRLLSFFIIYSYHFLAELESKKIIGSSLAGLNIPCTDVHPAMLAVSLFFLLSGAGLMLSDRFSLKKYISKRFMKIAIPFYIVYLLDLAFQWCLQGKSPFQPGIPLWRIVLTVCCVDEYFSMWGRATFSLGIGEWFLGALVILYAVFPILRYFLRKNRWITMGAATLLYIVLSFYYPFKISIYMNVLMKGYDFLLGMFLGMNLSEMGKNKKRTVGILGASAAGLLLTALLHLPLSLQIITLSVTVFLVLSFSEELLRKTGERTGKMLMIVSGYTFECFLIHHVIIYVISNRYLTGKTLSSLDTVLLYLAELLLTALIALAVRGLSKLAEKGLMKAGKALHLI